MKKIFISFFVGLLLITTDIFFAGAVIPDVVVISYNIDKYNNELSDDVKNKFMGCLLFYQSRLTTFVQQIDEVEKRGAKDKIAQIQDTFNELMKSVFKETSLLKKMIVQAKNLTEEKKREILLFVNLIENNMFYSVPQEVENEIKRKENNEEKVNKCKVWQEVALGTAKLYRLYASQF